MFVGKGRLPRSFNLIAGSRNCLTGRCSEGHKSLAAWNRETIVRWLTVPARTNNNTHNADSICYYFLLRLLKWSCRRTGTGTEEKRNGNLLNIENIEDFENLQQRIIQSETLLVCCSLDRESNVFASIKAPSLMQCTCCPITS